MAVPDVLAPAEALEFRLVFLAVMLCWRWLRLRSVPGGLVSVILGLVVGAVAWSLELLGT